MNISFTRGDNEADVKENHERLAAAVGYRTEDLVLTQQVHKTDILRVGKEDTGDVYRYPNRRIREIDGLVTDEPGVMLMAFFADCVPLIFYDPIKKAVGNAHSGWRGTVGAMGQKMVEPGCMKNLVPDRRYPAVIGTIHLPELLRSKR